MSTKTLPQAAIDLILESEGIDQPGKWPGGQSGITLGFGCDIGADPHSLEFWRGVLTDDQIARLAVAKGVTGQAAAHLQSQFRDIQVTKAQALTVFVERTLPREIDLTLQVFPHSETLPPKAFGALVSLVYNRGTSLEGSRRTEMRAIRDAIINSVENDEGEAPRIRANNLLSFIARQFREMKRLWLGQGLDGLLTRREAEAKLVESEMA